MSIDSWKLPITHLSYKGYLGTIEPDLESGMLFGKLAFIRDLVTYEANDLKALEQEFRASVDGYLEDCSELGKVPDTPVKARSTYALDTSCIWQPAWQPAERTFL